MTDSTFPQNEVTSVGHTLKTARLSQALTLEDISKSLCISKRQLTYLEEDEGHLPCDVYTLGFVKLYAQHLSLNVQEILEKFKEQKGNHTKITHSTFPTPLKGREIPSLRILGLSLFILTGIMIGWHWLGNDKMTPALQKITLTQPTHETSIEELIVPNEERASENEDLSALPNSVEGDHPLFKERAFSNRENPDKNEQDVPFVPKKWLD